MVFISRWARRRTKEFQILTFISMSRSKAATNNALFNEELHSSPEIISGGGFLRQFRQGQLALNASALIERYFLIALDVTS